MILATEHNIEAQNMYNSNETGFVMGHAISRCIVQIIGPPRDKNGGLFSADLPELNLRKDEAVQNGSWEFATVICCICTDGTFLDLAVIFKAKKLQDSWFSNMDSMPKNFLFSVSPNRWTDSLNAMAWL